VHPDAPTMPAFENELTEHLVSQSCVHTLIKNLFTIKQSELQTPIEITLNLLSDANHVTYQLLKITCFAERAFSDFCKELHSDTSGDS
jgi:hypothetical protein